MHRYIDLLRNNDLFTGICTENIGKFLECFNAKICTFSEGDYIIRSSSEMDRIAVLLEGSADLINEDFLGNTTILARMDRGDIFGEAHALLQYDIPTESLVAVCPATVIFLDIDCILTQIPELSDCQSQLRCNLMRLMAKKILKHAHKIEHISRRSTRQKLLSYFTEQMKKNQSPAFDIPFTRQQLADYLAVDRSAMSSELSRMQKDGIIRYNLNHFELVSDSESCLK